MSEPRYATEEWRWVTSEDGLFRKLVAGPDLLPLPRVVLECGNIDAEDADAILAGRRLAMACEQLIDMLGESCRTDSMAVLAAVRDCCVEIAKAKARREGKPDA